MVLGEPIMFHRIAAKTASLRRGLASVAAPKPVTFRLDSKEHSLQPLWLRLKDPAALTVNGQRMREISDLIHSTYVDYVSLQTPLPHARSGYSS